VATDRRGGEALGVPQYPGRHIAFHWAPSGVQLATLPLMTTAGILAAGVNIHHFFVDGVIWKLRDAATSSALMINIAELAAPGVVDLTRPKVVEA
jgi:hypothetical protein